MPWKDFFDPSALSKFYDLVNRHKNLYMVKYSHVPISTIQPQEFQDRQGYNLFVVPNSNIVGYYVIKRGREFLKIVKDEKLALKAKEEYEHFELNSIEYNQAPSFNVLRKNWVKTNDFGSWSWKDVSVEERGNRYFDYYDIHIRCWIWMYDQLIKYTVKEIKSELVDKIQSVTDKHQIKALEVGYGTGAVTIPTLSWINNINKDFAHKNPDCKIRFFGIDRSVNRMLPILKKKLRNNNIKLHPHVLEGGVAWDEPPSALRRMKFDFVILSLVLHDVISGSPLELFEKFLIESNKYITNNATIVITDVFPSIEPNKKKHQIAFWKKSMLEKGLDKDRIDQFFESNMDMIDTLHEEELIEVAQKFGYKVEIKNLPVENAVKSPFRIAILNKKKD